MKLKLDFEDVTPQDRLNLMLIRASEVGRIVGDIQAYGEPFQQESLLIEMADRHLLNALEVLKGIKFGRA